MEYVILAIMALGLVTWFANRRQQQALATQQAAELEASVAASRKMADEDVTKFGEELQRLDSAVAGHPLDAAMRQDYERALDAYEDAKRSLEAVTKPEQVSHVTEILEDGRYAIACVNARVEGRPLPQKRPPCFFNPAHGPSTENVDWAPAGGAMRSVPACAADAERVKAGADPVIRTVQNGSRRVPYYDAGPAYAPYARGYYSGWAGSNMIRDMVVGSVIFHGIGNLMGGGMGYGGGFGSELGEGIGDGFESIGDGFESIGDGFGDMLGGIGEGFGNLFD